MDAVTRSAEARAIIEANDRGTYTVPSPGLYPFQWNWDSAFTALGWAEIDIDRAWLEIQTLFEAQWTSGMVPHIVFWSDETSYFPGAGVWRTTERSARTRANVPTSGLSQPPVAATVVRSLLERDERDERDVGPLIQALDASHRWWHEARDPDSLGVMAVSHPWESGRDNLPDWDRPLAAVATDAIGAYQRRDLDLVDASMRPHQSDYDHYIALVEFGASTGWDDADVSCGSPFWVADPGVSAILIRAERDLAAMMEATGRDTSDVDARILRLEDGFEKFWSPSAGTYCAYDLRTGEHASSGTAASFLAPYAGLTTHHDQLMAEFASWSAASSFDVPSLDPRDPMFEPNRYWRGPVWLIFNYMIAIGFADLGAHAEADVIKASSRELVMSQGFAESFNPITGAAVGGPSFSWTAALWLAWAAQ